MSAPRSPDFLVFQVDPNVPDDKLLVDKFAEFNLRSDRLPKIGGGGHWAVPELLKVAGAENLEEGVPTRPRQLAGQRTEADLEKRFMAKTGEPWLPAMTSIFAYVHMLILKEALEKCGVADRRKIAQAIRDM